MINIRYYSSDHGLGHVSRDIAIIKELIKVPGVRVFVRNLSGSKLFADSFNKKVGVTPKRNDFGVINKKNDFSTDNEGTYSRLSEWKSTWDDFLKEEKRFCKGNDISIIVSDISPQPFILANDLGIPSVAVSNFTWHCIYSSLFGKNDPLVKDIGDSYRLASKSIILPFEQDNMILPSQTKTGLVCRDIEKSRSEIRNMLGVSKRDFLIFVSMGFSMENMPGFKIPEMPKGIRLVSNQLPNAIRIPSNFYNSQDIVAASDLVACKSGYTTVAESVSKKVPMVITARDGFVDDEAICSKVEKLGIGMRIPNRDFLSMDYLSNCMEFASRAKEQYNSLPKRFSSLHNEEVARIILSC